MQAAYFLGVDGGGSHTRVMVVDTDGNVVYRQQGGPSNVLVVGEERAAQSLADALGQWHGPVTGAVLGMAGADRAPVAQYWRRLAQGYWNEQVLVVGDYRIAWAAFTRLQPGVIGIFGTGSVVYGERGSTSVKVGGHGWRLGDAGSGLEIGRLAVNTALAALEGWGPRTTLVEEVLAWSQVDSAADLISRLYDRAFDWRRLADLAPAVISAHPTDAVARDIVAQQGQLVVRQLARVYETLFQPESASIGLSGGLASFWLDWVKPLWPYPAARLEVVEREPVWGAAEWARQLFGAGL